MITVRKTTFQWSRDPKRGIVSAPVRPVVARQVGLSWYVLKRGDLNDCGCPLSAWSEWMVFHKCGKFARSYHYCAEAIAAAKRAVLLYDADEEPVGEALSNLRKAFADQ
jgi:hypothetical protein